MKAEETTNYVMPTFKLKRNLVYFAANSANQVFYQELFPFEQVKGSVQLHCDNPIPFDLVKKIEVQSKNGRIA